MNTTIFTASCISDRINELQKRSVVNGDTQTAFQEEFMVGCFSNIHVHVEQPSANFPVQLMLSYFHIHRQLPPIEAFQEEFTLR